MELVGLFNSKDTSSKDIKVTNNQSPTPQNQSLMNIVAMCLDCRNLSGFSEKIILVALIRAAKRLKISLKNLKIVWKVVNS